MSNQTFEITIDGILQYRVNHDETLKAIENKDGDGHPDVNEIIEKRLKECINNLEKEINSITGVSSYDLIDLNFDGFATDD